MSDFSSRMHFHLLSIMTVLFLLMTVKSVCRFICCQSKQYVFIVVTSGQKCVVWSVVLKLCLHLLSVKTVFSLLSVEAMLFCLL